MTENMEPRLIGAFNWLMTKWRFGSRVSVKKEEWFMQARLHSQFAGLLNGADAPEREVL